MKRRISKTLTITGMLLLGLELYRPWLPAAAADDPLPALRGDLTLNHIDPTFTHQQALGPSGIFETFGLSVAISGETIVVGAQNHFIYFNFCSLFTDTGCSILDILQPQFRPDKGSAYVFVRSNGAWTQQQRLVASDGGLGDQFGTAVAISGDRIVVGAPIYGGGSAYVFVRAGGVWREQRKLTAKNAAPGDAFGSSVAISGETVVVGAPRADSPWFGDLGSAYVFEDSGGAWIQQQLVNIPLGIADLFFGSSVAISGDSLVVGAPADGFGRQGTATVFGRDGGVWRRQQTLLASDSAPGDQFGASVAMSGTTVVVGAPGDDDAGLADPGSAYVFAGNGAVWRQQQKLVNVSPAAGDRFGSAVAISGTTLVVGAPFDEVSGSYGTAPVFLSSGGVWSWQQTIFFGARIPWLPGSPVATSGETVVVGVAIPVLFGGSAAHVFDAQTRPAIEAASVERRAGSTPFAPLRSVVATVSDAQDDPSALTVTVNGAASATVNGVTVSAISIDTSGSVTASVGAASNASNATFVLRVTDSAGLFTETTLVVTIFVFIRPPDLGP